MLTTHQLANELLAQPDVPALVSIDGHTLDEYPEATLEDGTQFQVAELAPDGVISITLAAEDD